MLAYYEVMTGIQTDQKFTPNLYIDIGPAVNTKRAAVYAHECQSPDGFYPHHVNMEKERGHESGYNRAEAFVVEPYRPFPESDATRMSANRLTN